MEDTVEVLLIGSSHWNNYQRKGLDLVQTNEVDILSDKYQQELELISNKISEFAPSKIFVERTLQAQPRLDSLYKLYLTSNWGKDKRNEIFQLGFRVAAKLNHQKVFGIDFRNASFPFDSVVIAATEAKQFDLLNWFQQTIKNQESQYNRLVQEEKSLVEIFNYLNSPEQRRFDLGAYLNAINKAGNLDNTIGSFLASEWMKRNIYTYGLIQKYIDKEDKQIMILMGASHIAVLENLIRFNPKWKVVELSTIME